MKKYYMYTLKDNGDLQAVCNEAFNTPAEAAAEAEAKGLTAEETEICEITEDGDALVTDIIPLDEAKYYK